VLLRVLDGLGEFCEALLLRQLACVGRSEVLPFLRHRLWVAAEAMNRLKLAWGLAHLCEAEGLAALEALYWEGQKHPDDPAHWVPDLWILQDVLTDGLGTPAALALRDRLVAERHR
jgi:hypothetical protein